MRSNIFTKIVKEIKLTKIQTCRKMHLSAPIPEGTGRVPVRGTLRHNDIYNCTPRNIAWTLQFLWKYRTAGHPWPVVDLKIQLHPKTHHVSKVNRFVNRNVVYWNANVYICDALKKARDLPKVKSNKITTTTYSGSNSLVNRVSVLIIEAALKYKIYTMWIATT